MVPYRITLILQDKKLWYAYSWLLPPFYAYYAALDCSVVRIVRLMNILME